MRPKWKRRIVQVAAGALGGLALSTGAQAAFITYAASGTNATSLSATSEAIDLGSLMSSLSISTTLGLTVSSEAPATITAAGEGLQVVQGCVLAAASCGATDWVDITGQALSLGGTSFTQTVTPTETQSFSSGVIAYSGSPVWSLRLKWDSPEIAPSASVSASGTLNVTTAPVPEPGTWALMLAGLVGALGVARTGRRLMV